MHETFRSKLINGDLMIGTLMSLPSPEIAEILCWAGFDWLFIDLEHSPMEVKDAQAILQAAGPGTPCAVRVPSFDEFWLRKVLDIGPAGIIIPQARNAEEVARVVQLCKYPPEGKRSVGVARAQGYGGKFQEYISSANEKTAVIVQIEHIDAVKDIENITKVPGVDCLFIGPFDLSSSMDKIGLVSHPDVQEAILTVKNAAEKAEIPLGIFGVTADAVKPYIQSGYTLIAVSTDTFLIDGAAKNVTEMLK